MRHMPVSPRPDLSCSVALLLVAQDALHYGVERLNATSRSGRELVVADAILILVMNVCRVKSDTPTADKRPDYMHSFNLCTNSSSSSSSSVIPRFYRKIILRLRRPRHCHLRNVLLLFTVQLCAVVTVTDTDASAASRRLARRVPL
ncbi:Hypothetical protein CINCED_3A000753 [Cinara cedri]|uniref:Uncharacterized protein n=1 Tax=Cinara cedri TaxID=506608 RepID=A0A5E4MEC8_9HEMI|nr:Hypothetical protein CINCED_3A000753 [Cinara cedri]